MKDIELLIKYLTRKVTKYCLSYVIIRCELIKKSVDSSGGKANASLCIQFLFRIYYQIDTRFSFGTNMESCSVILNASYQLAI